MAFSFVKAWFVGERPHKNQERNSCCNSLSEEEMETHFALPQGGIQNYSRMGQSALAGD